MQAGLQNTERTLRSVLVVLHFKLDFKRQCRVKKVCPIGEQIRTNAASFRITVPQKANLNSGFVVLWRNSC